MLCDKCSNLFCYIKLQKDYYETILATDTEYCDWIKERLEKQGVKVRIMWKTIFVTKCDHRYYKK